MIQFNVFLSRVLTNYLEYDEQAYKLPEAFINTFLI